MRAVEHINLLQRTVAVPVVALAMVVLTLLTLAGSVAYGLHLRSAARQAATERDTLVQRVKATQARIAERSGADAAGAVAAGLRKEIDALKPQAELARLLTDAVGGDGGGADDFGRAVGAMAGLSEPGLWLTTLTVSNGGRRVELQGEARDGAAVLRYARRANTSLQPLDVRLDNLDLQPPAGSSVNPVASGGIVLFRLY